MRIAIFENIMTPGGNEVEFDRILVEELQNLGHGVSFYVPENFTFQLEYGVPATKINGAAVSYTSSHGLRKIFAAARREINRQRWYSQLFDAQKNFDALIIPSATYRYLRALNLNSLKKIAVPLIFIVHGVNPAEAASFLSESENLLPKKKIRDLLEAFVNGDYNRKVRLIIQGATMHREDADEFERIISGYEGREEISVVRESLIGEAWQRAIMSVDALLIPYSAPRYRYHWGGMLFTAIGYEKPVVTSDDMNPEVFEMYRIGETFRSGDLSDLLRVLEVFINNFGGNFPVYEKNLRAAAEKFSPSNFAKRLEKIICA